MASSLQRLEELDKLICGAINASVSLAEDLGDEDSERYQSELNEVESGLIDLVTMCNDVKLMQKSLSEVNACATTPYGDEQHNASDSVTLGEKFEALFESAKTASKKTFNPRTHPKYSELKKYLDEDAKEESLCIETTASDRDLVVDKVQTSLYCPLTKKLLEKAVTSKQCQHSYSQMAILEHIRKRRIPKCPVCNKDITETDLVPNRSLRKMVKQELASQKISSSPTGVVHL